MSATAFGLELTGDVTFPGTAAPASACPPGPPLRFQRATRAQLSADWAAGGAHVAGRGTFARVVRNERDDLLFRARGVGLFDLRDGVTVARYAPVERPRLPWQRYAVAQVLPFAALLRGFEVLHAGAVALAGGAVAVTAPSTGGKSTLLAALVQRGAGLVADDVVALELAGGDLIAHPGPALLSLRTTATGPLGGQAAVAALGPEVAAVQGSTWREVRRHAEPAPLRALVVLQRSRGASGVDLVRQASPDPRGLLGATFNAAWQERGRLTRMLDVCAALAASVPVIELHAPLDTAPAALAEAVEDAV